jgi:hypothetical protein
MRAGISGRLRVRAAQIRAFRPLTSHLDGRPRSASARRSPAWTAPASAGRWQRRAEYRLRRPAGAPAAITSRSERLQARLPIGFGAGTFSVLEFALRICCHEAHTPGVSPIIRPDHFSLVSESLDSRFDELVGPADNLPGPEP